MITSQAEKRVLQCVTALACAVPLSAGFSGMVAGSTMLGGGSLDMDSHYRYLSGLLFGVGLAFVSAIPAIETKSKRVLLLTAIVICGGIGRLLGCIIMEIPGKAMVLALGMELVVTPLLCLWQRRVASLLNKNNQRHLH